MNPWAVHRLPLPTTRRSRIAALGLFALLAAAGGSAAWLLDDDTRLRALIAQPLDPEPGVRIIELPGGSERILLQEPGLIADAVAWSPTGDHLWVLAHTEEEEATDSIAVRFLLVSYPDGRYAEIEFAEEDLGSPPAWSPDGTRAAFASHQAFYLFTSSGELLARYSEDELGLDLAGLGSSTSYWSDDSELVLTSIAEPARIIDRDGRLVAGVIGEKAGPLDFPGYVQWWPGEPRTLVRSGISQKDQPEWWRLQVDGDEIRETPLSGQPDVLQKLFVPPGSLPILAELEANAPTGNETVLATAIDQRAWLATFQRPGPDLQAIQLHGLFYSFESQTPLASTVYTSSVFVLDPMVEVTVVPPADTSGCPVHEFSCRSALHHLERLRSGDVKGFLELAHPKRFECSRPAQPSQPGASQACEGSTSGVPRYAFTLDDGTGQRWVSEREFEAFLESAAGRMEDARDGLKDEFGDGTPTIVSFTTGPPEPGSAGAGPTFANVTWIEGSKERPVRVVLGLEVRGGGAVVRSDDTGLRPALTGEPGGLPLDVTVSLWSPPNQR